MATKPKPTNTKKKKLPPPPAEMPEDDSITFNRTHFFSALVALAFAVGLLAGYAIWGGSGAAAPSVAMVVTATPLPPTSTPAPVVYDIDAEGYPSLGPADAPITIVEFSDYQCPFCYRWHAEVYRPLLEAYPDKIRFVYRNFPLSFHQNAFPAAEAALCAGDQNAYWKYHDVLFDNQPLLNDQAGTVLGQETYNQFASELGLDVTTFEECMTSHTYQQTILDDIAYANSLSPDSNGEAAVGGTPTFFINGHRLGGAYPIEYFKQIIDEELAKSN